MASEIYRERIYGNFKKSKAKRLAEKTRSKHNERNGNSEQHLSFIRKLPCCTCSKVPCGTAHHLKATGLRGMALRSPDKYAVPMCHDCHLNGVERAGSKNEVSWFQKNGIEDVLELANALWNASGDLPKMTKIVIAHKRR